MAGCFCRLYKGATPRLSRVAADTAIVFTLYELISAQLDKVFGVH
jgi:hypothetical protein